MLAMSGAGANLARPGLRQCFPRRGSSGCLPAIWSRSPRARTVPTSWCGGGTTQSCWAVRTTVRFGCGSPHGEVTAQPRASYEMQDAGSRAYASAGLPGAEWWVADSASGHPHSAHVELDDVQALYTENDLWPAVFDVTE